MLKRLTHPPPASEMALADLGVALGVDLVVDLVMDLGKAAAVVLVRAGASDSGRGKTAD